MRYQGGKEILAPRLVPELLKFKNGHSTYIEPFMGGGSIFSRMAPRFEQAIGADIVPDLILLWQALQAGWQPPESLSEQEHSQLRFASPSPLRAFAGFGCSFGGSWFGGYIAGPSGAPATRRGLLVKAATMANAHARFIHADYRTLNQVSPRCLIYCDPPYATTHGYKSGSRHFDTGKFWIQVSKWANQGATVLVSEFWAPEGVPCVWELERRVRIRQKSTHQAVEKLFAVVP